MNLKQVESIIMKNSTWATAEKTDSGFYIQHIDSGHFAWVNMVGENKGATCQDNMLYEFNEEEEKEFCKLTVMQLEAMWNHIEGKV
mgnify:CR=1 FL=1